MTDSDRFVASAVTVSLLGNSSAPHMNPAIGSRVSIVSWTMGCEEPVVPGSAAFLWCRVTAWRGVYRGDYFLDFSICLDYFLIFPGVAMPAAAT